MAIPSRLSRDSTDDGFRLKCAFDYEVPGPRSEGGILPFGDKACPRTYPPDYALERNLRSECGTEFTSRPAPQYVRHHGCGLGRRLVYKPRSL